MTPEKNPHANLHVMKFILQNVGGKSIYSDELLCNKNNEQGMTYLLSLFDCNMQFQDINKKRTTSIT